jgi:glyoxylase-like metal-dependent hydrolase (beta-lactamase superfamily II)
MQLTFLGTGTSTGVPSIGCDCETCLSEDPRDKRLRVSILIEHRDKKVLVDTSIDFRQQALRAGIRHLDAVLITHCHVDHVLGNYFVKEKYNTRLLIHEKEEPLLRAVKAYAPNYGLHQYQESAPDGYLAEGDTVKFGNQALAVLFVPGHSPGHIAFYDATHKILVGGDVLFYNSIGRTDMPGGSHSTLIKSIHDKLFILPDDVKVYPGHGPETTIGFEKRTNPFCALTNVK